MSSHRRCLLALGVVPLLLAAVASGPAQDAPSRSAAVVPDLRPSDLRPKEAKPGAVTAPTPTAPRAAAPLTEPAPRAGTRRSAIVRAIERVKGAVVNIHSERSVIAGGDHFTFTPSQNRVNGMGTGIVVDPRGYIVTNHHVIEDVSLLRIRLADGTTQNASVVARSPDVDLALIKIDPVQPLPTIPLGTAADLMVGETVLAIGNAFGYEHTVSLGIVSAIKRDVSLNKDMSYKSLIQTDASINPGNSGGPLVNVNGELVGVNVAIRAGAQGIGFAIPVDHMVRAVADMLRTRRRPSAYDGLAVRDRVNIANEIPVRSVMIERADGPAASAGLRAGDTLVRIGDVRVVCSYDVERAFLDVKAGDQVPVVVRRGDHEQRVDLAVGGVSTPDRVVRTRVTPASDVIWTKLGVQLNPVPTDMVTRVNRQLNGGLEVIDIADGPAAKAGIRKGDILVGLHSYEMLSADNVLYVLNHPELETFQPLAFYIVRGGQVRKGTIASVN
ncbi:MAG: trypsin-like peptidase domain-containing protein [Gemmataceae bacterium]|nr:trypsin-like peptidase domain-containing protein [Gemmataceae bacterium]